MRACKNSLLPSISKQKALYFKILLNPVCFLYLPLLHCIITGSNSCCCLCLCGVTSAVCLSHVTAKQKARLVLASVQEWGMYNGITSGKSYGCLVWSHQSLALRLRLFNDSTKHIPGIWLKQKMLDPTGSSDNLNMSHVEFRIQCTKLWCGNCCSSPPYPMKGSMTSAHLDYRISWVPAVWLLWMQRLYNSRYAQTA